MPDNTKADTQNHSHEQSEAVQSMTDAHQMMAQMQDKLSIEAAKSQTNNETHQKPDRTAGHQKGTSTKTGNQTPPPPGNTQAPATEKKK